MTLTNRPCRLRPRLATLALLLAFLKGPVAPAPRLANPMPSLLQGGLAQAAQGQPRHVALLIGVSQVKARPGQTQSSWPTLHTQQELTELRTVLMTHHGFTDKDILVLKDEQATKAAITQAVERHLLPGARPGARVFLHFSGHGQQVRDRSGDETDGLDESLVPYDGGDGSEASGALHNILDDQIADWLKALAARMRGPDHKVAGSLVLSLDSCFSGTAARGNLVERGLPWDVQRDGKKPQESARSREELVLEAAPGLLPDDYTLLSAALSTQTAKERDGMGVYSRALAAALKSLPPGTPARELMQEVASEVRSTVRDQEPQVEGRSNQALFGETQVKTGPVSLPVLRVLGDQVEIPAGRLHLASEGSVYALHRPGPAPLSNTTRIATATLVRADVLTSWLKLDAAGSGPLPTNEALQHARIVETKHLYAEPPLRLRCMNQAACQAPKVYAVLNELQTEHLLTLSGSSPSEQTSELLLRRRPGELALYTPESALPMISLPDSMGEAAQAEALRTRLRAAWRWQQLARLRQGDDAVQIGLRVMPVAVPLTAQGYARPDVEPTPLLKESRSSVTLPEGGMYQLQVENPTRNPLWVTILELGPDGSIQVLFPDSRQAGDGLIAPTKPDKPQPLPRSFLFRATAPRGTWTLKIFATLDPSDFGSLAQEALRANRSTGANLLGTLRGPDKSNPLARLLVETISGGLVRGERVPTSLGTWAAQTATIWIPESL